MEINRRDFMKSMAAAAGLLMLKPASKAMAKTANSDDYAMLIDVTKCVSCWWCYAACKDYNRLPETIKPDPADPPPLSPSIWTTLKTVKVDEEWQLEVYTQGQLPILNIPAIVDNKYILNTSGWKSGMYFIRIYYKDEVLWGTLIVNK